METHTFLGSPPTTLQRKELLMLENQTQIGKVLCLLEWHRRNLLFTHEPPIPLATIIFRKFKTFTLHSAKTVTSGASNYTLTPSPGGWKGRTQTIRFCSWDQDT